MRMLITLAGVLAFAGCAGRAAPSTADTPATLEGAEAVSLFGEPLVPPPLPTEVRGQYEQRLAEARAAAERSPGDADATIWLGRRTAYLGRYREAIDIFSRGMSQHPRDARFYRHRGHRFITVRRFDDAVADLERAARLIAGRADEVEPDGLPNVRNVPTSTLHSNIWYHLGLAHYLRGDLEAALRAYREALAVSGTPDMLVATTHWAYMTLRRMGRPMDAAALLGPIQPGMDVIENGGYHRLLLMYKGLLGADEVLAATGDADPVQDATVGYGVANWHLYNGRRAEGEAMLRRVLASGQWPAFGYIAAEADLRRLGARRD